MRQHIPATLAFVASALLSATLPAQNSTPVIGYYKVNVPAGDTAWVYGFVSKTDFQGVSTGASGLTLMQSTASWAPGQFANGYYVELLEGSAANIALDIIANTATSLTVDSLPSGYVLPVGVKYCIRKHATLGTAFPASSGFGAFDSVTLYNYISDPLDPDYGQTLEESYTWSGSFWRRLGQNSNDVIIKPGQGFIISAGDSRTIVFGASSVNCVKTTPTRIPVFASADIQYVGLVNPLVSSQSPTFYQLGQMGLIESLSVFDSIAVYLNDGSFGGEVAYTRATAAGVPIMKNIETNQNANDVNMPAGPAFVITVGGDRYYTQPVLHPAQ